MVSWGGQHQGDKGDKNENDKVEMRTKGGGTRMTGRRRMRMTENDEGGKMMGRMRTMGGQGGDENENDEG
jgi:hypothetical protein